MWLEVDEAVKWADVMMMATPDDLRAEIYRDHLHANMGVMVFIVRYSSISRRGELCSARFAGEAAGKSVSLTHDVQAPPS